MSKSVNVSVRLSPETHAILQARAQSQRRPLAGLLGLILEEAAQPREPRDAIMPHPMAIAETLRTFDRAELDRIVKRLLGPVSEPREPRFKRTHKVAAKVLDQ